MALFGIITLTFFAKLSALICLIIVTRGIYRLKLHPLAKFPGPKRAAVSSFYGATWDIPRKTSFVRQFTKWHDEFNSDVIRIAPNQLHIRNFDSYNEIFKTSSKFGRDPSYYEVPMAEGSFWTNPNLREGLSHRSLYHQYFSKIAVQKLEPTIHEQLSRLLAGIDDMRKRGVPVDLTLASRCFSADTLGSYMFNQSFGFLESPDFQCTTVMQLEELVDMLPVSWYAGKAFGQLLKLLNMLPRSWIEKTSVSANLKIYDVCAARIREILDRPPAEGLPNIFQAASKSVTEKGQPQVSHQQLVSDAVVFFAAGSESTANMISYCIYHLLQHPTYLQSLRAELSVVVPRSATMIATSPHPPTFPVSWIDLERLPLLRAAVKETLRLYYGVPGRLPRVVPPGGVLLAGWQIPADTVVSSCSYVYHNDEDFYSNPLEFRPDRWFITHDVNEPDRFPNNGGVDPEKHFLPFSRGSRNCIGIHLAYAELYTVIAYLLRNYELELFDTKPEDMDWHDCLISSPFGHLKVKIVGLVD